ncbi:hypothetical protein Tco_1076314 [Tanacetum coccineum]
MEEHVRNLEAFDNNTHQMNYNSLVLRSIHSGTIIDWSFLADNGLERGFFKSIHFDPFSGTQWANLFRINEPIYQELVRVFFATFELEVVSGINNPQHASIHFRLGRDKRTLSLVELVTIKVERLIMEFWSTIGDGVFTVGNIVAKRIQDPRIRLAHRCIGVVCNIPYWLAHYLKGVRKKEMVYDGLGSREEVLDRHGDCYGARTRRLSLTCDTSNTPLEEDAEGEEATEGEAGGYADAYRDMSKGDWQVRQGLWMDQQDRRWGQLES